MRLSLRRLVRKCGQAHCCLPYGKGRTGCKSGAPDTFRAGFLSLALALILSACAIEGDFGRPRYAGFADRLDRSPDSGSWLAFAKGRRSSSLTADEIEMRDTAFRLRTQIHNNRPIGHLLSSEESYANYLSRQGHLYGPARMAKIDHELHADHQALTLFGQAARRVLAADRERIRALQEVGRDLNEADERKAHGRIRDNYAYIEETFEAIRMRIAAYEYAIDRTRIETPGIRTDAVASSLEHLRDRSASLDYELSQLFALTDERAGGSRAQVAWRRDRDTGPSAPINLNPRTDSRRFRGTPPFK